MSDNKTLATILAKITSFKNEKKSIDNKIAGLEIAYEALTGSRVPTDVPKPAAVTVKPAPTLAKKSKPPKRGRVDRKATVHTLAFLQQRLASGLGPTKISTIANAMRCTYGAANMRCFMMWKEHGLIRQVKKGVYEAYAPVTSTDTAKNGGFATMGPVVSSYAKVS